MFEMCTYPLRAVTTIVYFQKSSVVWEGMEVEVEVEWW
jgi:hypothetical protein